MVESSDADTKGPIQRLIAACARNPFLTLFTVGALALWGYYSLREVPLDAIPDLSDAQVIILTEWQGRSPDLIEDQITYPISAALNAAPGVKFVRGQSFLGLSFVYVIFEDGTDIYWARSRVLEYLNSVGGRLPDGVTPTLGPDATGVGWVFQYALIDKSGNNDLADLRSLQDWNLRYALESVDGVAEVASVGGFVKQYQINLDPEKILAFNIPIQKVIAAVRRSNNDVGGRVFETSGHEYMVRGRGYIKSKSDIETIPVGIGDKGVPILISDIAQVSIGPDMRRGVAELNGEGEAVGGIVIMRYGENALTTINNVKERLAEIEKALPEGVEIVVTYDRSDLIKRSIATLRTTLFEELIVVSLVITVFLLHLRSALIPILTLPIAVLLAFIPMGFQNLTASIMSLGGIAIAIGAMVDASIIIIENIHKKLEHWDEEGKEGSRSGVIIKAGDHRSHAGGGPQHLLLAARHHHRVPTGIHSGKYRGPSLQTAGIHEDLLHGVRGNPCCHASPRLGRNSYQRKDTWRTVKSDQPIFSVGLYPGGAIRRAPPLAGARRSCRGDGGDSARGLPTGERVHATAQ